MKSKKIIFIVLVIFLSFVGFLYTQREKVETISQEGSTVQLNETPVNELHKLNDGLSYDSLH